MGNNKTYYTVIHIRLHDYKSMVIHTFHQSSSLHFTSPHFTSLHFTPHFSLPSTCGRFIITLKIPSFPFTSLNFNSFHFTSLHLTCNYFLNPLSKNMRYARESRQRICRQWFPVFDGPIYKGIFPDISSLFPGPNFSIIFIPAQVAQSF